MEKKHKEVAGFNTLGLNLFQTSGIVMRMRSRIADLLFIQGRKFANYF